jgi:hypothetical protein
METTLKPSERPMLSSNRTVDVRSRVHEGSLTAQTARDLLTWSNREEQGDAPPLQVIGAAPDFI